MGKYKAEERTLIKSIVALTIKRIGDSEIINQIYEQTYKTISKQLCDIRKKIKWAGLIPQK